MRTKTSVFRLKQNTNNKKRTHPLEKMMDDYMGSPVVLDRSCVFVPFGGGYKVLGKTFSKHQENQNISINEIQKTQAKGTDLWEKIMGQQFCLFCSGLFVFAGFGRQKGRI